MHGRRHGHLPTDTRDGGGGQPHIVGTLIEREALPQVLIRVGIAPVTEELPSATPRRPLADVLEIRV